MKSQRVKDPIIAVERLVKRYKKATSNAVDDISFAVKPGEFFTLLGPNGAGKTTTISILTTTLTKTSGTVTIAGYDLDKDSSNVRQNIGVIFQSPSLDANLTAEENIRFHAVLYGLYRYQPIYSFMPESYKSRVSTLAEVLGIEKEIFQPIKTFSGGMKRKLEIIRSLLHNPKILFLDEPTSGLDPLSRKNLWEYLNQVRKKEKTTIFLTTHYLEEAEEADTVCIINHGKIVELGKPAEIKQHLTEEYLVVDARERELLKKELTMLGLTVKEKGPFRIELGDKTAQETIGQIQTPLSMLRIHNPTLEEAYLDVVERSNHDA